MELFSWVVISLNIISNIIYKSVKIKKIISLSNKWQNLYPRPNHAWTAINLGLYNSTHPQVVSLWRCNTGTACQRNVAPPGYGSIYWPGVVSHWTCCLYNLHPSLPFLGSKIHVACHETFIHLVVKFTKHI